MFLHCFASVSACVATVVLQIGAVAGNACENLIDLYTQSQDDPSVYIDYGTRCYCFSQSDPQALLQLDDVFELGACRLKEYEELDLIVEYVGCSNLERN